MADTKTDAQPKGKHYLLNGVLAVSILLAAGLTYTVLHKNSHGTEHAVAENNSQEKEAVISDSLQPDTSAIVSNDDPYAITTEPSTELKVAPEPPPGSKHYLIGGTFINYSNAKKESGRLKSKGYDTAILRSENSGHTFYRIYLEKSDDITAIRSRRNLLREQTGMDLWVYSE